MCGVQVQLHSFLTMTQDGVEGSSVYPCCFTSVKEPSVQTEQGWTVCRTDTKEMAHPVLGMELWLGPAACSAVAVVTAIAGPDTLLELLILRLILVLQCLVKVLLFSTVTDVVLCHTSKW